MQATYSLGIWNNVQTSNPQTYLTSTVNGRADIRRRSGFASNKYIWDQTHLSNAVSLKSDTKGVYDFDLSASSYNYLQDIMLNPFTVRRRRASAIRRTARSRATTAPTGRMPTPRASGVHSVSMVRRKSASVFTAIAISSKIRCSRRRSGTRRLRRAPVNSTPRLGETRTGALWVQDAWKIVPNLKLTLGGRLETWRALDGFNVNTSDNGAAGAITSTAAMNQPALASTNFSPKASLSYDPNKDWNVTANFGEAYRYPTVTELYQNMTVGGVATFANPNLTPEQDFNGELNIERKWNDGRVRLTLFKERTQQRHHFANQPCDELDRRRKLRPRPSATSTRSGCRASSCRAKRTTSLQRPGIVRQRNLRRFADSERSDLGRDQR